MGAGIGDIRPHIANLVLNDGPFIGELAATPSVQEAILELVQAAITGGVIVTGANASRLAPQIRHSLSSSDPSQAIAFVLNPAVGGTAPTFVAATGADATVAADASLDITKPAGLDAGDVLFAFVAQNNPNGFLAPGSGWHWASENLNEGDPADCGLLWRVVDGTEPSTIGFVTPGGGFMQGVLCGYRGVNATVPIATPGVQVANTNAPSGPADSAVINAPTVAGNYNANAILVSVMQSLGGSGSWASAAIPNSAATVNVRYGAITANIGWVDTLF